MVFDALVGDADLVVVRLCGEDGVAKREGVVRQTTGAHLAHSEGLPDVGCRSQSLAISELKHPNLVCDQIGPVGANTFRFRSLNSRGPHTTAFILSLAQSSL